MFRYPQRQKSHKQDTNIAIYNAVGTWLSVILTTGIVILTFEILELNKRNVTNTQQMVEALQQINNTLSVKEELKNV